MDQNQLTPVKTKRKNVKYGIAGFSISTVFLVLLILFWLLLSILLCAFALYISGLPVDFSSEISRAFAGLLILMSIILGIMVIFAAVPVAAGISYVGFCFGITSIRHQPTKVMSVFSRIITYTLLFATLVFAALTVYLWVYGGFYKIAIHYFFEIINSIIEGIF